MGIRTPIQNRNRSCLALFLVLLAIFVLAGTGIYAAYSYYNNKPPIVCGCVLPGNGSEYTDISGGNYSFDTGRPDGKLKIQASNDFKNGDITDAGVLWRQAITLDSSDAEVLIYLEDQFVLASHKPYITFVVGTMLTGNASDISTGRDNLQGAYVAQKEYNDGFKLKGGVLVRLLIANAGSQSANAAKVAQEIVQLTKSDPTITAVMGWPFSSFALNAIPVLTQAHIPMVSPTASSDALTGKSSFFFRVAPSNRSQAIAGAHYAEQQLQVTRAAIFVDPKDAYSASLASDFSQQFIQDGNQIVATENYTVGNSTMLPTLLQAAMNSNPQLIYFAGYSDDIGVLLTDLPTDVQIMGGDALYELGGYPTSARAGFERLHFTAFAYPDEWLYLNQTQPPFFAIYAQDFDPNHQHSSSPYGYSRPDNDVILSYDAMLALLQAGNNALAAGNTISLLPGLLQQSLRGMSGSRVSNSTPLTPDVLQQYLTKITGSQGVQGISGQISFGSNGDPINKAIVVLYVDSNGDIHLSVNNGIQGCFILGQCNNSQ